MCVSVDSSGVCAYTDKPMSTSIPGFGMFCENQCGLKEAVMRRLHFTTQPKASQKTQKTDSLPSAADRFIESMHKWIDNQAKQQ